MNILIDDQGKLDVIFCRNVLMYLSADMRDKVIRRLTGLLSKGGWFIVSPSETSFVNLPSLHPVRFSGAILHRKGAPRRADKKPAKMVVPRRAAPTPPARPAARVHRKKAPDPKPAPRPRALPKKEKRKEPERDLYQEALSLYEKGSYAETAEKLNMLLSDEKKEDNILLVPEQMALLAKAYANMGKLDEAKKWCEQAVKSEKIHPDYHYLLATIYQEQGLVEEPVKSLKHAIYLDPDLVMAYFLLGHLTRGMVRRVNPGSISETPSVCYLPCFRRRLFLILTDSRPRDSGKQLGR